MEMLLKGQRTDADPQFKSAELYAAFAEANKRRGVAVSSHQAAGGTRIVRTRPVTSASDMALRLANINYGPAYTLTVKNHAPVPLLLWMAQKDGTQTTPLACPAGAVTVLTREKLGPDTARYLMGQFEGTAGGSATVVVWRMVAISDSTPNNVIKTARKTCVPGPFWHLIKPSRIRAHFEDPGGYKTRSLWVFRKR